MNHVGVLAVAVTILGVVYAMNTLTHVQNIPVGRFVR